MLSCNGITLNYDILYFIARKFDDFKEFMESAS